MAGIVLPIPMRWDGEHMVPLAGHTRRADDQFVIGAVYPMVEAADRSPETHKHFFATVREAWNHLPESLAERFPSDKHLRKFALIKSGHCDQRSLVCATKAEAQRVAAFMKQADGYDLITVRDNVVVHYTAHSQAEKAMGREVFQKSKDDVFRVISQMIGVEVTSLRKAAA
jgi:hypothetical protein